MGEKGFTKLDDENYDSWEFEIRAELKRKQVLALVEGKESRPVGSDGSKAVKGWIAKRDLASAEIVRRLDPGQFAHVRGYDEDPAGMWERLRDFHQASGLGSIIAMWGKFTSFRKADEVSMRTHIGNIRTLADKLDHLGETPSNALTIAVLFKSLPPAYSSLIVSLDSHEKSTDLDFVIGRILNEETRLADNCSNHTHGIETSALHADSRPRNKNIDKSKIRCFRCNEFGHYQSECKEPAPAAPEPKAMVASTSRVTYAL